MRHIARLLFAVLAGFLLHSLITHPYSSDAPSLSRIHDQPLNWAATPKSAALAASVEDAPIGNVTEPDPEPEPEPAEPGDIFALMYHDLTTDESNTSVWRTTPDAMRSDLQQLADMGYIPLSIEDYITGDYEIGPDYYIVTFDDGYTSNLTLAQPLLEELGVPACVFVITDSVGIEGHMTWDELRQMQDDGVFTIYSHTHTHATAQDMTAAAFIKDANTAWNALLAHLDEPEHMILSYPNGAYTRETMRTLAKAGYELFTIQNRPWWYEEGNKDGIRVLVRMNIAYEADMVGLVDYNRKNGGFGTVEEKLAAIAAAEAEALANERAERRAWMEQYGVSG